MPTAARLAAAVCFALLGWGASDLIVDALPFERNLGWFYEINTLIAVLCGWFIAGSRAPAGYGGAISYGLTATAGFIFWGLLFHSSHEMIQLSLRRQYDNAMEAVVAVFDIGLGIRADHADPGYHPDLPDRWDRGGYGNGMVRPTV